MPVSERAAVAADAPVALVTGAARRIGRAIAEDLAAHGFQVAIHTHTSRKDAEHLCRAIATAGGRAAVVTGDLTRPDAPAQVMAAAGAALGPVRLLVNSASIFERDEIGELELARYERHFAIHTRAPVFLAQEMAGALPEATTALVVNVIDQRVWKLTPQFFSYTLSKAALWTATQTMAQALAPHIRVNGIGPGPTLANTRQQAEDFNKQADAVLLRRGPGLCEFGCTIRFLWETPSITGQMIALDGGQHLAWETPDVVGVGE
jgi:NAD(P)-dependent dehydrogenase (short-subunit alcohol dehydrogenase family)